jgi:anti-sigma-K factor RskA
MNDSSRDDRFDAAMRQSYDAATNRLSARTQAQLQQRRRAASSGQPALEPSRRHFGWPVAASFAAVLALAIGLQVRWQPESTATVPIVADNDDNLDTVLDENPDFYLWLASSDANALAME